MGQQGTIRMDARLQQLGLWPDFHSGFVYHLRVHLRQALRPRYIVTVEERVYVSADPPVGGPYRPDMAVMRRGGRPTPRAPGAATTSVAAPLVVTLPRPETVRERFVEVRTASEGELVTVVELLPPNNKAPGHEGRRAYLAKRQELLETAVHLVEIDLLTGGERMPLTEPWPPCAYAVLVAPGNRRPTAELYVVPHPDAPLPTIPFPLRAPDPDYPLDLQRLFEDVWKQGDYAAMLAERRPTP